MSSDNGSRNTHVGVVIDKRPKKTPQVKGDKAKVKKLDELKKVTKQLDKLTEFKMPKKTSKEIKIDKLFDKKFKLKEQLGIE